jgi:hypothetical protein
MEQDKARIIFESSKRILMTRRNPALRKFRAQLDNAAHDGGTG